MRHSKQSEQNPGAGTDDASNALLNETRLLRAAFEGAGAGMAILDPSGRFQRTNPALRETLGFSGENLLGGALADLAHQEDRALVSESIEELAKGSQNEIRIEARFMRNGGGSVRARLSAAVILDAHRAVCGIMCEVEDISEQTRSQKTIRELAAFAEYNPNPVFEFSPDGGLRYANRAAIDLARGAGKSDPASILPPETREVVAQCWITGKSRLRLTTRLAGRTISWSFFPIAAIGRVHCYAGDITERLALEEQLLQSQRLEAVGQLAAGVAHDFNNILTVIQGNVSMLMADERLSSDGVESAQLIADAAGRGSNLARQLLVFSRKQALQPVRLDLNAAVNNMARLLKRVLGENISLRSELAPDLPPIFADAGMMEQILMNLAVNSRDAMPKGGVLTIRTGVNEVGADAALRSPGARPGRFVRLSVEDTGHGIAPENLRRVFEPFFTTKELGKGSGLGLATVYGIVQRHQGWVEIQSELGQGAIIGVNFPILEDAPPQAEAGTPDHAQQPQAPSTAAPKPGTGGETILMVEDEEALRTMICGLLSRAGYRVLSAASGDLAMEIWAAHKETVRLLFTDVVMPGAIDGLELARRLKAEKPALKIILTSGYAIDPEILAQLDRQSSRFLQKPYYPQILAREMRECLDA